jgi:uncharacterized metal-binding protein
MVDLPKKKVGIVACSGEELPEGTITRLAALRVLENLRPDDTVTICLPLFLAGGEGDRAFARFYPTISIDGCELRCAQRATERYSNKPATSLVVRDVIAKESLEQPAGKRRLNQAGGRAVEITAQVIARSVDELLGKAWSREVGDVIEQQTPGEPPKISAQEPEVATCACGSGIPVQKVMIAGQAVTLVGLPLIFQQFAEAGKNPNDVNLGELMETIKIYNPIPKDEEDLYIDGVRKAYTDFWFKARDK